MIAKTCVASGSGRSQAARGSTDATAVPTEPNSEVTRMTLVVFSWHGRVVLFVAQMELRLVESVAMALALQHGIDRCEIAVTYKEV